VIRLGFHGAARTVTGSRFLLGVNGERLLIDCGAFQGLKDLRLRNWEGTAFDPEKVDWVVLTHGHIDHCGYLPRLVKDGFRGRVYGTPQTCELIELMLMDAAHLHEEEAEYRNFKGFTRHRPALPLFEKRDVEMTLRLVEPHPYGKWLRLSKQIAVRLGDVGHLLGSAMVEVRVEDERRRVTLLFSGDVGRYDVPYYPDPGPPPACDVLVVESTYGDRLHTGADLFDQVEALAKKVFRRGGVLLVPAFAVGRAQQVIYMLRVLMEKGRIPEVPIHLDSPMAAEATRLYARYPAEHRMDDPRPGGESTHLTDRLIYVHQTRQDSVRLNSFAGPGVVVSASGMLTGGRILHHIEHYLPDPKHMVVLAGYQAAGTRGRALLEGARTIKVHGKMIPVRAEIGDICGLSGHADADELMRWLRPLAASRPRAFVVHGEPRSADAFAGRLHDEMGLEATAPALDDVAEI